MYRFFSNRRLVLIVILIVSNIIVFGVSLVIIYNKSILTLKTTLTDIAERQKSLVTVLHEQGKNEMEIIQLIKKMREKHYSIGKTGEFVIASNKGNSVNFLLVFREQTKFNINNPEGYGFPIRMALQGKTGVVFAKDYYGIPVLAAYTYVPELQWGIVAKISTKEVNRPYYEAIFIASLIAILFILLCIVFFIKIFEPITKSIISSEEHYRNLFENNHMCMLVINPSTLKIVDANPAACEYYGYKHKAMVSMNVSEINTSPPDEIKLRLTNMIPDQKNYFILKHKLY